MWMKKLLSVENEEFSHKERYTGGLGGIGNIEHDNRCGGHRHVTGKPRPPVHIL